MLCSGQARIAICHGAWGQVASAPFPLNLFSAALSPQNPTNTIFNNSTVLSFFDMHSSVNV